MALKYRLIYFNVTGLAEPIRYLFAYGKIHYEDCRLEYEEWKAYKPKTPFGQIPVLEINGKPYNQTTAICRHLAKQVNLMGKSNLDAFQADILVDTITDFRLSKIMPLIFKKKTEEEKEKKLFDIRMTYNPYYLGKFEKVVFNNGGYFVNNQLTWADIFFSSLADLWIKVCKEPILEAYPNLKSLKIKVDSVPNIKVYRESRPKTLY